MPDVAILEIYRKNELVLTVKYSEFVESITKHLKSVKKVADEDN